MPVNFISLMPRLLTLIFTLTMMLAAVQAADEYTGQFVMELAPDRENLDQVVFQPASDLAKYQLTRPIESGARVTFSFLYHGNTEKLEIPALLVEPGSGNPYLWADANLDKQFDESERFVFKREEENNPYIWDAVVNQPLKSGVFKSFPLFVKFFRDVRREDMGEDDRLALQSSDVFARGFVDLQGKKTLVAYAYNPRSKKISLTNGKVGIDCDGNGEIDWDRFSPEAAEYSEETVVFRVGASYVSHKKVDLEKNLIILKAHPAADYKRIELKVGDAMPDFEFKDFAGKKRRLSDFRGKYVLLDFWAIWCGPCRREMPYLKAAYQRYNARGFEILGMNADESDYISQVKTWLEKNNLPWTQATRESILPVLRSLRIIYYPTTLLLDPEGKVVSLNLTRRGQLDLRGEDLLRSLQTVFSPAAARSTAGKSESGATIGNVTLPAAPAGFAWKAVEQVRVFFMMPDGWHYKEEAKGATIAFFASSEKPGQNGEFDTGLSVNIVRKNPGNMSELAQKTIEKLSAANEVLGKSQHQSGVFEQYLCVVRNGQRIEYNMLMVNVKTNTLITVTFEAPMEKWNEVWQQQGQTILSRLIFDEGI
jgi:thiol-disulfide isomerase/thioredoxin